MTATIGDLLTDTEKQALRSATQGSATDQPTAEQENAVKDGLNAVKQRASGKKHRPSSKQGPITPTEFRDLMNASQNIDETLGNKEFVAGIFAFIKTENKVGEYQAALGEFVSKYKAFDSVQQEAIRLRLADAIGTVIPDRRQIFTATKNGFTAVDELLMILFYDDEEAFRELEGRNGLACRKRARNWEAAYSKLWAIEQDQADEKEAAEIRAKIEAGTATAGDLSRLVVSPLKEPKKPKVAGRKRPSFEDILAGIVLFIGHPYLSKYRLGLGDTMTADQQADLENKIVTLAIVGYEKFDAAKFDAAKTAQRETLNQRINMNADEKAKSNALDLMKDLKESVKTPEREAEEVETETV